MSTTTKISLVGTAIASVASLLYAIYRKTEENRALREENIRMEERSAYAPVVQKSKKHKRYKPKGVHWEYDRYSDDWVLVDGDFEDPYEEMYQQRRQDTIVVHGNPPVQTQIQNRPQYYPQPYERPFERVVYNSPVYDQYGNEVNRYFGGNQYNGMNNRYYQGYQTHYMNYPDQYNRSCEPVGYAWGDPYYYGNVVPNGYCPAYAYNQVL